jgi:hypothetical protein
MRKRLIPPAPIEYGGLTATVADQLAALKRTRGLSNTLTTHAHCTT